MRKLFILIFMLFTLSGFVYAKETRPIRIAVSHFLPPFVFEGANKELSGFDISLMGYICQEMERTCVFIPMKSTQVLSAVANHDADVGIGAITITLDRYKLVGFSIPYMLSESRFLGTKSMTVMPFTEESLSNKTIGVQEGSVIETQLKRYPNFKKIKIIRFADGDKLVAALSDGSIDLALVYNATAMYWQNHSAGALYALGLSFSFGYGIGISVNRDDVELTQAINKAILRYQKTAAFNDLYTSYFGEFS